MKLRILHKGLAFLLIPLALQLALVAQLFHLVDQAEILANEEERVTALANIRGEITSEFAKPLADVIAARPEANDAAQNFRTDINRQLQLARQLVTDAREREGLLEVENVANEYYRLLKELGPSLSPGQISLSSIAALYARKSKIVDIQQRAKQLGGKLTKKEKDLQETRHAAEAARECLKFDLLLGIVLEFALTVLMVAIFLKDITRRLSVLVANSNQIAGGEQLTRTVTGSDEIAHLDQVLHSASEALRRTAEYRRSLTQMVAHDLRAPLMSARLVVDALLGKDAASAETQESRLKIVRRTLSQITGFAEDLLTIEKLEAGKLELNQEFVDIKDTIANAVDTVSAAAANKSIVVEQKVPSTNLMADPSRILQVLTNLLSNAIKYSPAGSSVTITSSKGADTLKICVHDSGPGIADPDKQTIFEKFTQTSSQDAKEGFGLGLAICKLIVDAHEGEIGVTTPPAGGSIFWFTLPYDDEQE